MQIKQLTKQYDGKTVVDGVTFSIPKGKVISLIGPNDGDDLPADRPRQRAGGF